MSETPAQLAVWVRENLTPYLHGEHKRRGKVMPRDLATRLEEIAGFLDGYDERVRGLLTYNNDQVERRRAAEANLAKVIENLKVP